VSQLSLRSQLSHLSIDAPIASFRGAGPITAARLAARGIAEPVMIDCSHGNSLKDHRKQAVVAASICEQVASGSWQIFGAMLESHLLEGRQDYVPGRPAVYGQSITDACISLEQTDVLLEQFATAQQARGARP